MLKKQRVKNGSLVMAASVFATMIPQNAVSAIAKEVEGKELFSNNFQAASLPDEANGFINLNDISIAKVGESNKALKINLKDKLENQKTDFGFITHYGKKVVKGAKLEYDIIIPSDSKNFTGEIKTGGIFTDSNLKSEILDESALKNVEFKDLGNGFSKAHVISTVNKEISDLYKVNIEIAGVKSNYSGDLYVDNVKVTEPSLNEVKEEKVQNTAEEKKGDNAKADPSQSMTWNFNDESKGLDGWKLGGVWDYNNSPEVSYDKNAVGTGALKLVTDFTKNKNTGWSEIKLNPTLSPKMDPNQYNVVKFNLYYNPANMTQGSFKTKFYVDDNINDTADIDLSKGEDAGNGLKKVPVTLKYHSKNVSLDRYLRVDSFVLSIVGSSTDYKGALYIDDINLSYDPGRQDIYVKKEVDAQPQEKIDLTSLQTPDKVKLVDGDAIDSVRSLRAYLEGVGKTDKAIFGHQNDAYNKAGLIKGADEGDYLKSDTKDVTGSLAGVCGMDGLSFTTYELGLKEGDNRPLPIVAAEIAKAAAKQGSIITLSCHMPNFDVVKNRPKINGNYDYSGYTPGITTGNVVQRIMPGGDLNDVFTEYLDLVAQYGNELQKDGIPVIFRPFHENNGSWFWWGKAYCDAQAYKNLYAYTVEYLRDVKGIHNFLYAYSPNGTFKGEDDYLERYPGDEFVDIVAFDQYQQNPGKHGEDTWFKDVLQDDVNIVQSVAKKHGKLPACSEIGMGITKSPNYELSNCAAPQYGLLNKQWYSDVAKVIEESDLPYFMTWANFNPTDNFYVPYMVDETHGQEMLNDFINYYNEDGSIFADGNGNYSNLNVSKDEAYEYGYIKSPVSGNRILEPTTIEAKVKSNKESNTVKFNIKDTKGNIIKTLDASLDPNDGYYKADITKEVLDAVGTKFADIELVVNNESKSTSNYIFNMPETQSVNEVVDDFEGYYGQDELIKKEWSVTNANGCSSEPILVTDDNGNHTLKFKYFISTVWVSSGEGYTGMVKSKTADWTGYDALQFKIKPDDKHQKLVIQVTCNGEDFEYYPQFTSTDWQTLTIPFSEFKGKNGGTFDPSHIEKFGIWCNTAVPEGHEGGFEVDSSMEFDDIKAVKVSDEDPIKKAEDAVKKAEDTLNRSDLEYARKLVDALSGTEKDALEKRLDAVENSVKDKEALDAAVKAVEKAEKTGDPEDITEARKLVDALNGSQKDELEKRLDDVQKKADADADDKGASVSKTEDNDDNGLSNGNSARKGYAAKTGDSQNFMLLALSLAGALSLCVMKMLQRAKNIIKSR